MECRQNPQCCRAKKIRVMKRSRIAWLAVDQVNEAKRDHKARLWITPPCPTSSLEPIGLFPVISAGYLLCRQTTGETGTCRGVV